ncbi:carboxypeptidase-like regulatory domain-containing protein [Pedobacter sp. SL55]|uniref:carboxypeptidase-like regulatory domain-containing protein n=1 Tax=Pedobacter sp. SL55 TaxID=2995161 RepID=UPI00226F8542|nr:carboxypeptidase-like regulatory domain-containing protein [Pedobacter sp. SL55]WAC39574.1 carboxypeptidase-like regulatory domain-containing protein [Pedobacter sp. SL55]
MKKITYLCCICMLLLSIKANAQKRQISGVVSDQSGGVPGATVVEKGNPSNGTTTNQEGKFTLNVNSNVLVVRLIGYTSKEINIDGKTNITVSLQEDKTTLDDVVVVGYGTQKKKTLTGAVASIGGDEIRQSPSPSLQNTLAGRITGFASQQTSGQPGADGARFYIRG